MSSPVSYSATLVAYLLLFAGVGFVFVLVNLLIGWLIRPSNPYDEKLEIYECGEPSIGSSFVQFDLRFYVVALVFIIFDVEVAFLFPWATVFGKTTNLLSAVNADQEILQPAGEGELVLSGNIQALYRELGVRNPEVIGSTTPASVTEGIVSGTQALMLLSVVAVMIFFVVLLIGFAYEWKTGALDWVRAITQERRSAVSPGLSVRTEEPESVLSA